MPSPPHPDAPVVRRTVRWLAPAALLALVPKCLLCVLAYAGLGTALGLGGPERCGAPPPAATAWPTALAAVGALAGLIAWCRRRVSRG